VAGPPLVTILLLSNKWNRFKTNGWIAIIVYIATHSVSAVRNTSPDFTSSHVFNKKLPRWCHIKKIDF
jgi:hypothetical protein